MAVTVFGGGAVQTAYVSFQALDITANSITLVWPTSYFDVPAVVDDVHYDVLAASWTVNTGIANANTITLPNAKESSVGSNFIVTNIGASSFRLLKSNGDELIVVPNGLNNVVTGTATLFNGSVTVNTNAVVAGSNIQATRNTPSLVVGDISVPSGSIIPNTSFAINSDDPLDASTVSWVITNPLSFNSFWVQLIDNTTPEGIWQFVQFGAGTSQAQASALAGNGLVALDNFLNTNIAVKPIPNAPYNVLITDRAKLLLWQTGAGTMTLPLIASVPAGFYISVNNDGSGVLTITGNATIDNTPSIDVSKGQSLSIISDGTKWWSLGFGQNIASSHFESGNSIAPSITFTEDIKTGIYYYKTSFPPVTPPGIGFTVNSSQIANITADGLYMNAGNIIVVQDETNVAQTLLISDANFGQLSWDSNISPLANPPTLNISGTNTQSTLELGPFGIFTISQSATNAFVIYKENLIWSMDDTGKSSFPNNVEFDNTGSVTFKGPIVSNNTATFNGISSFEDSITFNAPADFNNTVTLANPLLISDGGTGQTTQAAAIKALLPTTPPIGSMIYYDNTGNWIVVSPGAIGNTLKLVNDGMGNPVPQWQP